MGEFVKVRGLPSHGRIHQGKGQFVKVRGLPSHGRIHQGRSQFVKVRGIPAHGRICQGKGLPNDGEIHGGLIIRQCKRSI